MNDSYMEHGWGDTKWNGKPATFSIEDFKKAYNSGARIINEALSEANDKRNERNEKIEELRLKAGMKPSKMFGEKKKPIQLNIWHGYDMNRYNPHSTYLMHSGRKGMKWGKNIYQEDYVPIGKEAQGTKIGGGFGGSRGVAVSGNVAGGGSGGNRGSGSVDMSTRQRYQPKDATNRTGQAVGEVAETLLTPKWLKFAQTLDKADDMREKATRPIIEEAVAKQYEKKLNQNGWKVYVSRIDNMTEEEKQAFDKANKTQYSGTFLRTYGADDPSGGHYSAKLYKPNHIDYGTDVYGQGATSYTILREQPKGTLNQILDEKAKDLNDIDDEMVDSVVRAQLVDKMNEQYDPNAAYATNNASLGGESYKNQSELTAARTRQAQNAMTSVNSDRENTKAVTETIVNSSDNPQMIEANLKKQFGPDTTVSWDSPYDGGPVICNVEYPAKDVSGIAIPPYSYTVKPEKVNEKIYKKQEMQDSSRAAGEKKTEEQRKRGMEIGQKALEETKRRAEEQAEARRKAALNSSSIARDMAEKTGSSVGGNVSEGRAIREAQKKARELAETKLKGQAVREAQKKAREDEELKARGRAVREAQKKKKANAGAARAMGNAYSSMYNMRKRMTHSERFSYGGLYSTDELYHWGILGMKWGRRRWQNEDGSLTEAGRVHYGYTSEREKNRHAEKVNEQQIELTKASRGGDRDSYKSKYDLKKLQVKQDKQKQDEARDKRRHEEELAKMKYRDAEQKRKNDAAKIRNEYKLEKLKAKNAQKLSKYELQTDREDMRRDYEEAREMNQFDYVYDRAEQRGRQVAERKANSVAGKALTAAVVVGAVAVGAPLVKKYLGKADFSGIKDTAKNVADKAEKIVNSDAGKVITNAVTQAKDNKNVAQQVKEKANDSKKSGSSNIFDPSKIPVYTKSDMYNDPEYWKFAKAIGRR